VVAQASASDYRADDKDVLKIRVSNSTGDTVPLPLSHRARITQPLSRCTLNLIRRLSFDGGLVGAGFSQGEAAIKIMEKLAAETRRKVLLCMGRRSPFSNARRKHGVLASCSRAVRVPGVAGGAVRKPDAAVAVIMIVADVSD